MHQSTQRRTTGLVVALATALACALGPVTARADERPTAAEAVQDAVEAQEGAEVTEAAEPADERGQDVSQGQGSEVAPSADGQGVLPEVEAPTADTGDDDAPQQEGQPAADEAQPAQQGTADAEPQVVEAPEQPAVPEGAQGTDEEPRATRDDLQATQEPQAPVQDEPAFASQVDEAVSAATPTPSKQELALDSYDAGTLLANNKVYALSRKAGSQVVVTNRDGVMLRAADDALDGYWRVKNLGGGRYQLISMKDGSMLSYAADGSAPATATTGVWLLLKRLNGTYSLVPEDFAELRLQALGSKDGSALGLRKASGSAAQGFAFTLATWLTTAAKKGAKVAEGIYELNCGVGNKQVVQVSKSSKKDGANVLTYKQTTYANQRWRLVSAGNNLYTLRAVHSDKLLAVQGGATTSESNVCQSKADGSLSQYWYLIKKGSQYLIRNAKSGLGLSVKGARAKNGTNMQVFTANSSDAQRYGLVRDVALEQAIQAGKPLAEGIYSVTAGVGKKLVLDVKGSSTAKGAQVQFATSADTLNQKVELTYLGYGLYTVQFANSGKYLHVKGGSSKAGASVIQWGYMARSRSQKWYLVKTEGGYQLRSAISGLALEVKGGAAKSGTVAVMQKADAAKASENLKLAQVRLLPNGSYVFASALNPAQLVEVKNSWKKAGTNVQVGRMRKAAGQMWTITYLGNSTYKIVSRNSKLALEVAGGSKVSGANVDQGTYTGAATQKWVLGISDTGALTLKNLGSGKYLDLAGGKSAGGTNVQQYKRVEGKRQSFLPYTEASSFVQTGKTGYQNPSQYYQISAYNCVLPSYAKGFYTYVSPSGISPLATRAQCVEAFIAHAMKYLGTPYVWDWSMRPGQGVDCSGLVMQCLYAVGMQTPYNTYDHMFDPWQDHNAENMHADKKFKQISFSQRKRGDLIFYQGHVGIYLGNDQIINAYPPKVQIQSVYSWTVTGCSRVFV